MKTWEEAKGFLVPWNVNCALCPEKETLQHVFMYCSNAQLFWAKLRAVLKVDLYPTWRNMKFLDLEECENSQCFEMLLLIGLYSIWRSRTDHLLVLKFGKPAWRYFVEGFMYGDDIISATEELDSDVVACWASLKSRLQAPM